MCDSGLRVDASALLDTAEDAVYAGGRLRGVIRVVASAVHADDLSRWNARWHAWWKRRRLVHHDLFLLHPSPKRREVKSKSRRGAHRKQQAL